MDLISGIKIDLMNVNGINNQKKQKQCITYFNTIHSDIIILVDTRLKENTEQEFKNRTNIYDIYSTLSNGPTTSRGVSILINKSLPINIKKIDRDEINSNYLILETEIYGEPLLITGVYAPNKDEPAFQKFIFNKIAATGIKMKIKAGDYNITRDPKIDNDNYAGNNNKKARKTLNKLLKQHNFHDYLREQDPDKKLYTYYSYKGTQRARLDYIFHSEELEPAIVESSLLEMPVSDHRGVSITLDFARFKKGKGIWALPLHLLKDPEYKNTVHENIKEVYMRYYRHSTYENFYTDSTESERAEFKEYSWEELPKLPMKKNIKTVMEEIWIIIRGATVKYAHEKRGKTADEIKTIRNQIKKLDLQTDLSREDFVNENRKLVEQLEILTTDQYFKKEVEWIQAGERLSPTLKDINSKQKCQRFIPKLIETDTNGNEIIITCQKKIEGRAKGYFENLFNKAEINHEEKLEDFLPENHSTRQISPETKEKLDQLITIEELTDALDDTSNNSVPGEDGFGYNFYKAFWPALKYTILAVHNRILISRKLPTSQRNGIINLIPKGNKDKRFLDNWRPIMLLNCCYKLLSSVMARRLQEALQEIISPDQTGFLKNRYINENNVTTCEVIEDAKRKDKLGLMLAIDFSKAFDCISHEFIRKSLRHFGFGDKFVSYINTLISDFQAAVLHAGNLTEYFKLGRGAKQGDPIAALLFIIAVEILCIRLREDRDIKHYVIDDETDTKVKLVIYADDLNLFLEYDENSLAKAIKILEDFKNLSGLEIQVKKTQVVLLGRKYNETEHKLCRNLSLKWNQKFRLLGLDYDAFNVQDITVNYENKLNEIFDEMGHWRTKFLSIRARKNIVNGLFLSKLTHIAAVLPNLPDKEIRKIESRLYEFIWGGAAKIERQESKLSYESGGMNFPDLSSAWMALKLPWLRRLTYNTDTKWYEVLNIQIKRIDNSIKLEKFTSWSTTQIATVRRKIESRIWKAIFQSLEVYIKKDLVLNKEKALKLNIWGNGILKNNAGNKISLGKVRSLEQQNILPAQLLDHNPNGNIGVLSLEILTDTFKKVKKNHMKNAHEALTNLINSLDHSKIDSSYKTPCRPYLQENIHKYKKGSSWWVKSLKMNPDVLKNVRKRENKWRNVLNDQSLDRNFWDTQYKMITKVKFDNKMHINQYQIMKGNIKTNIHVHKFNNSIPETCSYGCQTKETTEHLFYKCPVIQNLINQINTYLPTWTNNSPFSSIKDFLFMNRMKKIDARETSKIVIKYFIQRTRCSRQIEDLNLEKYKEYLYNFMRPHKKARSLDFLKENKLWTELNAAPNIIN